MYYGKLKSSLNPNDSIVVPFEITESTFSLDNGSISAAKGFGSDDGGGFQAYPFRSDRGAVFNSGPNGFAGDSIVATFAFENPGAFLGESFSYFLYEAQSVTSWFDSPSGSSGLFGGSGNDYGLSTIIASAQHIITVADTLSPHLLISETLKDYNLTSNLNNLLPNRQYMLVVRYDVTGTVFESPKFSYTHKEDFIGADETVYSEDWLYMAGYEIKPAPILRLNLVSCPNSSSIDTHIACDSYTWIDGITYTASNNFATQTLSNAAGCDSIVTLDLTINSNSSTDVQSACDSYAWMDGNTYTSSNNSATYVLTNGAGCDSTVTLDLTINSNASTDTHVACDSYIWIDGNTYTSSNNSATQILTNSAGCDSLVTLDLTINANASTDVQSACDSYMWIDGNTYTSSNNSATYVLINSSGCDSIVSLDLTINANASTDVQTACQSYTWINGNTYSSSINTISHLLTNAFGCDSIVTLDLTISSVDLGITESNNILISGSSSGTYQWLDCSDNYAVIPGETSQLFFPTVNGDYAVRVENSLCIDTSACLTVDYVGLDHLLLENELTIYPNPSIDGMFKIDFSGEIQKIEIMDLVGRMIVLPSENNNELIDGSQFASGKYLVKCHTNNGVIVKEIIISR